MNTLKTFAKRALGPEMTAAIRRCFWAFGDSSQAGETALLKKIVGDYKLQPWIIDVGAHDGIRISNSFPFVKCGWYSILIEPSPAVFKRLAANCGRRKNVTCLQIACSDKLGEADLYFGSDGEDGGLS